MAKLDPRERWLLNFLCACAHQGAQVTRVKSSMAAALRSLRYAGLIAMNGFQPSASAMADWLKAQKTAAENDAQPEGPPPPAVEKAGGAAAARSLIAEIEAAPPIANPEDLAGGSAPPADAPARREPAKESAAAPLEHAARPPLDPEHICPSCQKLSIAAGPLCAICTGAYVIIGRLAFLLNAGAPSALPEAASAASPPEPQPAQLPPAGAHLSGADLADEIDEYLKSSGMTRSRFGRLCFNRPSAVRDLSKIQNPTGPTIAKARAFIANPPADALSRVLDPGSRPDRVAKKRGRPRKHPIAYEPSSAGSNPDDVKMALAHKRSSDAVRQRNREAAMARIEAGLSSGKAKSVHLKITQREIEAEMAEAARLQCPIEQAKTILRRRYCPVVGAEYADPPGPKGKFLVGRKLVSEEELLAMAERLAA